MSAVPARIDPRCLTREQAAGYCGIGATTFDDWVRRGLVPGSIPGTHRWDRKAIDAALDRLSGLNDAPLSGYDQWKREHAADHA